MTLSLHSGKTQLPLFAQLRNIVSSNQLVPQPCATCPAVLTICSPCVNHLLTMYDNLLTMCSPCVQHNLTSCTLPSCVTQKHACAQCCNTWPNPKLSCSNWIVPHPFAPCPADSKHASAHNVATPDQMQTQHRAPFPAVGPPNSEQRVGKQTQ